MNNIPSVVIRRAPESDDPPPRQSLLQQVLAPEKTRVLNGRTADGASTTLRTLSQHCRQRAGATGFDETAGQEEAS